VGVRSTSGTRASPISAAKRCIAAARLADCVRWR
jgi:hypothetical protein